MFQHRINIFISHSWHHSGHYNTLQSWIFKNTWTVQDQRLPMGQVSLFFCDNSVPKENPIHTGGNIHLLENAISMKILNSHVVIIPMGMYARSSEWIKREVNFANRYRKPKLAVNIRGQGRSPGIVRKNADEQARWNPESIIKKIWQLYNRPTSQLKNRFLP